MNTSTKIINQISVELKPDCKIDIGEKFIVSSIAHNGRRAHCLLSKMGLTNNTESLN